MSNAQVNFEKQLQTPEFTFDTERKQEFDQRDLSPEGREILRKHHASPLYIFHNSPLFLPKGNNNNYINESYRARMHRQKRPLSFVKYIESNKKNHE